MPFDFGSLQKQPAYETVTAPREIFNALPGRSRNLEYLRDGQASVLESWFRRRSERDLVIKINTGGGKTVVGLLILQSCLNEKEGPALYVAPDTYLVEQVRRQARDLGLETVEDPRDSGYISGKRIAVVNVHKLMNGRSVFGGPANTQPDHVRIGSMIVDDVHAAISTTGSQFSLTFGSSSEIHHALWELFEDALMDQAEGACRAMKDGDNTAPILIVPFWEWQKKAGDIASLMQAHIDDGEIEWKWPLIRNHISLCRAAFSPRGVEIAPPCLPVSEVKGYGQAQRRVFLTATLADDSVLVTTFDASPISISNPITPESASDQGDRLILAPQEINKNISEDEVKAAAKVLSSRFNVVVLVPSERRARYWRDVADLEVNVDNMPGAVERLRSEIVGLVVFINKYDGIDLPDDACRVLVIDMLPEVYGILERRDAEVLGSSDSLFDRQMQRIEQGMGRGVRGANDHCVVLLLGAKLTQRIATQVLAEQFSPVTKAQLELSRSVALGLDDATMTELLEVIFQVLDRDIAWVTSSRDALAGISYGPGNVRNAAIAEREAFDHAGTHQYRSAAKVMQVAANAEVDAGAKGLLKESLASYTNFSDQASAQRILASAIRDNRRILRPLEGFSYERLSPHADQAKAVAEYLAANITRPDDLILRVRAILDDLKFDPDRTAQFENAMEDLGSFLGFVSARPERDSGNGPDNLWALGGMNYLVIECKSGAESNEISRTDIGQLANSMFWFHEKYDPSCKATPVMVHPNRRLHVKASASTGTRIITREKLEDLRGHVLDLAQSLTTSGAFVDIAEIGLRIESAQLTAKQLLLIHSSLTKNS
jgi:hypothetical protein